MSGKPYKIGENATLGRYLVATRDILAGESIIDELPIVTGPICDQLKIIPGEVGSCLVCCVKMFQSTYVCTICGLTLFCSEPCGKDESHLAQECKVIQKLMVRTTLKFPSAKELHNFVLVIRCLLCRVQCESKWSQIQTLESKVNELEKLGAFKEISPLFDLLNWEDFDFDSTESITDLAKHCLGAMITNAFSIFLPSFSRQGLYFLSSYMSHSCRMNTDRQLHPKKDGRMVTRAARLIQAGEPITTSYLACLSGTHERWVETTTGWRFTCRCDRCTNSEHEVGTHVSTIRCPRCGELSLCPSVKISGEDGLNWACVGQNKSCNYGIVQLNYADTTDETFPWKIVQYMENMKPKDVNNLDEVEAWLDKYCDKCDDKDRLIHKDHCLFIQVKLYLLQCYGRNLEGGITSLDNVRLVRKLNYCEDVLKIVDILFKGLYEMRGERQSIGKY